MKKRLEDLKDILRGIFLLALCAVFFIGVTPMKFAYADETKLLETKNGTTNVRIIGENGPSVVFETGYADAIITEGKDIWNGVQDNVAKYSKTISYDRFGLGKSSDIGNMPSLSDKERDVILNGGYIKYNKNNFEGQYKTARDKAINLHNVLEKANIKKPYVLVAHSIGSLTVIEFSKLYKNDVAGIVMLDGTPPDINSQMYKWSKAKGSNFAEESFSQLTNQDGNMDEVLISGLQCQKDLKSLKNIPILYLQASDEGFGEEFNQLWEGCIVNMLSNFKSSKRIVVPNSTHYVHKDNPDFVNDAIKNFIDEISLR
ncbi:alpha/beta fold hydrolase [Clostridium sp. YIM B02500]|uniref:alpha/beta fold hydrolase n=1 Tax=Clostridium sp. YIM B02500 TaxID=2910681 RepID=UPI001EEEF446|nr:alpha/beta fold hydrolase [Clostridium sp. YIM B02500]